MFVLFCLVLLSTACCNIMNMCSGGITLGIHDTRETVINQGTNPVYKYTTELTVGQLSNGQTACFKLFDSSDSEVGRFAVQLGDVTGRANFNDEYQFGVPNATATCTCSCADGGAILSSCDESEFCDEYNPHRDKCVSIKEETDVKTGCTELLANSPKICCSIGFKQEEVSGRYKAFQIKDEVDYTVNVNIYPDYMTEESYSQKMTLDESDVMLQDVIFNTVKLDTTGGTGSVVSPSHWYIGKSEPYSADVYSTTFTVNGKSEYLISQAGWLRYNDEAKKYSFEYVTDSEIKASFERQVKDCGASKISSTFNSPKIEDFETSLRVIGQFESRVKMIHWETDGTQNHGSVYWTYKDGTIETSLILKFEGAGYSVEKVSNRAVIGTVAAQVIITETGDRYIQLNLTKSFGKLFGTYFAREENEEKEYDFSIDCLNWDLCITYISSTELKCNKNFQGRLCIVTQDSQESEKCVENMICSETKIPDYLIANNTIYTEEVISDDPLNWRTWAKFMNPLEWFNGIKSWQEAAMLIVEVVGVIATIGVVLKVLKLFGILGKCCRIMWCCCMCPKTEEKVKRRLSHSRIRMSSFYSTARRRLTSAVPTRNHVVGRMRSLRQSQKKEVDRMIRRNTFVDLKTRLRTSTVVLAGYLMGRSRYEEDDTHQLTEVLPSETPTSATDEIPRGPGVASGIECPDWKDIAGSNVKIQKIVRIDEVVSVRQKLASTDDEGTDC